MCHPSCSQQLRANRTWKKPGHTGQGGAQRTTAMTPGYEATELLTERKGRVIAGNIHSRAKPPGFEADSDTYWSC